MSKEPSATAAKPLTPSDILGRLPKSLMKARYSHERYPGAPGVLGVDQGANCQLFAYEVLKRFGRSVPPFRSSQLWEDDSHSTRVESPEPLDLVLFNAKYQSWGAHIGVYVGDDRVLHLCKEVGVPVVWKLSAFKERYRYSVMLGGKRF